MPEFFDDRGILYLISGTRHLVVLAVSIFSLRKSGYNGPIHIAVGDDAAAEVVSLIAQDKVLHGVYRNLSWAKWTKPEGHGSGYAQKTFMHGLSPFGQTIFLDADTVVRGNLDPLFTPKPFGVTLTQFSDWRSNGRKIPGRIKSWTDVAPGDVAEMLSKSYPAINTGVLSWRKSPEADAFFQEWRELTAKKPVFINDELAAQLIFWRHAVRVLDSRWNYSPIHGGINNWITAHFHGKKHVNREQGRVIWMPLYDECCRDDIASINDWTPAGDKRLREYLSGSLTESRDGAGEPDDEETEVAPDEVEDAAV